MKALLSRHKFYKDNEVLALRPSELAKELRVSVPYAVDIQKNIRAAGSQTIPPASKQELRNAVAAPTLVNSLYPPVASRVARTTSASSSISETSIESSVNALSGTELPDVERQKLQDAAAHVSVGARYCLNPGTSALEIAAKQIYDPQNAIFTLSQDLDSLLGGNGLEIGALTEVCGVPGAGKTQLAIQIACNVTVPKEFGGCEGAAVYIDTEGSFVAARALEIAEALCRHMRKLAADEPPDSPIYQAAHAHNPRLVLSKIHVYRVFDHVEQASVIEALPAFLQAHPDIRVVIIDSVAFHLRRISSPLQRTKALSRMSERLQELASKFDLAVLLVNQVTRRVVQANESAANAATNAANGIDENSVVGSEGYLMPALGDNWGHMLRHRIILKWQGAVRVATVLKSPTLGQIDVPFRVIRDGVRDCLLPHLQRDVVSQDQPHARDHPQVTQRDSTSSPSTMGSPSTTSPAGSMAIPDDGKADATPAATSTSPYQLDMNIDVEAVPLSVEEVTVATQCAEGQDVLSEAIDVTQIDYFTE